MSEHDVLTDLPNRLLLTDRLSQAIARARRNHKQLAVMFLDLDGFKHINDSLGHAVGDKLLQSVAARISACVRESENGRRQGGAAFAIVLSEDTPTADPGICAAQLLSHVQSE